MRRFSPISIIACALIFMGAGCLGGNDSGRSGPAGMYVSTDKGENWQQIASLPTPDGVKSIAGVSVYRVLEDPRDPKSLYISSRGHGMFYTYDDARSWSQAASPLASGFVYSTAVHPENNCTIFSTNGGQVFKSVDCNRNWTEVYRESRSGVLVSGITFDQFIPQRVLMVEQNGDLLQSLDQGQSWRTIHRFGKNMADIISDPLQPNVFFAVTRNDGIFRSTDGGTTWEHLKKNVEKFSGALDYRRFLLHPTIPGKLYWISLHGILVSNDNGNTWERMNLITPPGSVNIFAFAVNPSNDKEMYYTATLMDNTRSTFYRTVDGGANWTTKKMPTDQVPVYLRVHKDHPEWVYLGFAAL